MEEIKYCRYSCPLMTHVLSNKNEGNAPEHPVNVHVPLELLPSFALSLPCFPRLSSFHLGSGRVVGGSRRGGGDGSNGRGECSSDPVVGLSVWNVDYVT